MSQATSDEAAAPTQPLRPGLEDREPPVLEPPVPEPPALEQLVLEPLHRRLGARWRSAEGRTVPAHYGDPGSEYEALHRGCALVDRSWMERLELLGEDRRRFVNGQMTCDVKELAPGQGTYGFFTSVKGRVEADALVLATEDRLRIELPAGTASGIADRLRKYIIADRVEVARITDPVSLAVIGPAAAAGLERLLGPGSLPSEPWGHRRGDLAGKPATWIRHMGLGQQGFLLWVDADDAVTVAEALLDGIPGLAPAGYDALDVTRLEAGVPWFGLDFGADNFPQETGIEGAVSYTKGCYLGQEVVARLHYRGQVSRQLRGLVLGGEDLPMVGAEVSYEDRPAGSVTSVALSPALKRPIALALLQRRAFEPGTEVEVAGAGTAVVRALPLV